MAKKQRILIVEDEVVVAEDIASSLKSAGYAVPAIADSGEEAIQWAGEAQPDLVLMDIILSGKTDGIHRRRANTCSVKYSGNLFNRIFG